MRSTDPYGVADDEDDELPVLPIPRPGEQPRAAGPRPEPIAPPRLGGGASFTAAQHSSGSTAHERPDLDAPEHGRVDTERLTWDLAARLTQGMLANPSRNHASVKDAMGLFDQFLHEMHAYVRIASEFDLLGSEAERRRNHGSYFHGHTASDDVQQDSATAASATPPPQPKPAPAQPRPSSSYAPIPPGARGPYAPGSMAGSPPPSPDDEDDSSGTRAA